MENQEHRDTDRQAEGGATNSRESLPEDRPGVVKLFVGGLSGDITHEVILKYFRQFGDILEAFVIYEKRRPSGFGFINVANQQVADIILGQKHQINKSRLDVKPAVDRSSAKVQGLDEKKKKIFVGGLPKNFPDDELLAYFNQYGTVQRCYVAKNPITGKTRGFGFVVFDLEDSVTKAFTKTNHIIGGQEVHLKIATDKSERQKDNSAEDEHEESAVAHIDPQSDPKTKPKAKDKKKAGENFDKPIPDPKHASIGSIPSSGNRLPNPQKVAHRPSQDEFGSHQSEDQPLPAQVHAPPTKKEKPLIKKLTLKDQPDSARNSKRAALTHQPSGHTEAKTFSKTDSTAAHTTAKGKGPLGRTLLSKPSADTQFDTPSFMGRPSPMGMRTEDDFGGYHPGVYNQGGPRDQRLSQYTIDQGPYYQGSNVHSANNQMHHNTTQFGFHHSPYQGHQHPKRRGRNDGHYGHHQYAQGLNYGHIGQQDYYQDYNSNQPVMDYGADDRTYHHQQPRKQTERGWKTGSNDMQSWNHPSPQMEANYPSSRLAPGYPGAPPAPRSYQQLNQWQNLDPLFMESQPSQGLAQTPSSYHAEQQYGDSYYPDEPIESPDTRNIVLSAEPVQQFFSEDSHSGNPSAHEILDSGGHTGDANLGQQTNHPSFDSGEQPQNPPQAEGFPMQLNPNPAIGPSIPNDQHYSFSQRAAAVSQVKTVPNSLNNTPTKTPRGGMYRKSTSKEFHRGASREIPAFVIYEHPTEENNPESNLLGAIEEVDDPAQEKALESAQRVIDAGTPMSGRFARPLNHQSSTEAHKPAEEDDETNKNLSPGGVDLRQAFALNRAAIYIMMTGRNAISGAEREGPQPIAVRNTQSSIQMETRLDVLDMMLSMRDEPHDQQDQNSHHEGTLKSEGEASSNKQLSARSPDGLPNRSDSPFKAMPQFKFHQSSALVISVTEQAKIDSQIPKSTAEIGFSSSSGNLDRQPRYKENPFVPGEAENDGSSEEELQRAEDI